MLIVVVADDDDDVVVVCCLLFFFCCCLLLFAVVVCYLLFVCCLLFVVVYCWTVLFVIFYNPFSSYLQIQAAAQRPQEAKSRDKKAKTAQQREWSGASQPPPRSQSAAEEAKAQPSGNATGDEQEQGRATAQLLFVGAAIAAVVIAYSFFRARQT